jgi:hypothetical protein
MNGALPMESQLCLVLSEAAFIAYVMALLAREHSNG